MITKEQIEDYILRNSPVASEKYVENGILWAISQMQAENARLREALKHIERISGKFGQDLINMYAKEALKQ